MRSPISLLLFFSVSLSFAFSLASSSAIASDVLDPANATDSALNGSAKDSFADMFDRALQKEFPDSEQSAGETDPGGFNNSVAEKQAVLETVARVTSKKNETKEEKSYKFQDVFNNEDQAEDIPTLIDRKDNVFIISNPKSKYPILKLDLRLISDLVVVIVSATCGGIAFACIGQPMITGYLLAGSLIGPGGLNFVSEIVQEIENEKQRNDSYRRRHHIPYRGKSSSDITLARLVRNWNHLQSYTE